MIQFFVLIRKTCENRKFENYCHSIFERIRDRVVGVLSRISASWSKPKRGGGGIFTKLIAFNETSLEG